MVSVRVPNPLLPLLRVSTRCGLPLSKGTKLKKTKPGKPARLKMMANKQRKMPPFVFKFGAQSVIDGLEYGMKTMLEGGRREVIIPPNYGCVHAFCFVPPIAVLKVLSCWGAVFGCSTLF